VPNFKIDKSYFFAIYFFPESGVIFSSAKTQNSAEIAPWRINLSLQKYTFCDNWTKIVAQS
jgi:hypothetical protein